MEIKDNNHHHNLYIVRVYGNTVLKQFGITLKEYFLNPTDNIKTDMKLDLKNPLDYEIAVTTFFNYLMMNKYPDTPSLYKVRESYERLKVFGLPDVKIEEILLECFGDTAAFNNIEREYSFRLSEDPQIKNIRRKFYESFKPNTCYSSADIRRIVCDIINAEGGECKSSKKAITILKFLFETEVTSKRINGKKVRGFTIKNRK